MVVLKLFPDDAGCKHIIERHLRVLPKPVMSQSRKPRPRSGRRKLERDQHQLLDRKLKLATLSEGGSASRPISVESSSVVEGRATTFPCLACEQNTHVLAHEALTNGLHRLRQVTVGCTRCGTRRVLFFKIAGPALN